MKKNKSVRQKILRETNRQVYFPISIALLLMISIMLSGCSPSPSTSSAPPAPEGETQAPAADLPPILGIGTHPIGGTYYACGSGLAKVISDHSPINVTVQPSGGPSAYMPSIQSGELAMGLMGGTDVAWAYAGEQGYEPSTNLRVLLTGHRVITLAFAVRMDSGITKVADLKGKMVGYGYGGDVNGQAVMTACLEAAGLSWDDVQKIPIPDASQGFSSIQEGRVDATFGGQPISSQSMEADSLVPLNGLNFADIPPEEVANIPAEIDAIVQKYLPSAKLVAVEKQGILKNDVTLTAYNAWLAASALISDDAAYEITRVLYEYTEELHDQHVLLAEWERDKLFDPNPYAPYHDGAVRFWKEKGLWTDEAEANQQRLLALLK